MKNVTLVYIGIIRNSTVFHRKLLLERQNEEDIFVRAVRARLHFYRR